MQPRPVKTAAAPSTLALIESKIRWRSRESTVNAATITAPEQDPAKNATAITVGVPRPPAFDDSGQTADVGAVDDRHQAAESSDQEGDNPAATAAVTSTRSR